MTELSSIVRQRLVDQMVEIVAQNIGPDFDFVLVVRSGIERSCVLTDVPRDQARSMLFDACTIPTCRAEKLGDELGDRNGMPRKSATATKVGNPEPLPFEAQGSHSSGVGGSRTAPPATVANAREKPRASRLGYKTRGCRRMCATKRRHPPDIGETRASRE